MANSSERVRFFLEQSVPELQELLRKDVFTKDEIAAVNKRRSDFEHTINARGHASSEYVRYAAYEQNLEALKKKRLHRLGIKNFSHGGQRRIFFIYERATRKFPGDVGLWMQYLDYARSLKAHKRVGKIFTAVVRLHPTNPELWARAAQYAVQSQGEFGAARSYLQRGLRFCPQDRPLWIEYGRLELLYIEKTLQHMHVLGVQTNGNATSTSAQESSLILEAQSEEMPAKELNEKDKAALSQLATTPAMTGAIPVAIYDSAIKELGPNGSFSVDYFDMVASYHRLSCCQTILKHIIGCLQAEVPTTAAWAICSFKQPLVGIDLTSSKFPMALRHALQMLRSAISQQRRAETRFQTAYEAILILLPISLNAAVDVDVRKVVRTVLKQMLQILGSDRVADHVPRMIEAGNVAEAQYLLKLAIKVEPDSAVLQSLVTKHRESG